MERIDHLNHFAFASHTSVARGDVYLACLVVCQLLLELLYFVDLHLCGKFER